MADRTPEQIEAERQLYAMTGVDPREIALLRDIYADPETKLEQQKLFAKVKPATRAAMPELAMHEEVSKATAELRKVQAEIQQERETEKIARTRLMAIKDAMDDPEIRLRAEEIAEVEQLMTARFIGNYKDGARLFRAEHVAAPRMDAGGISLPGQTETDDAYFKALWNAPNAAARDKLAAAEALKMQHEFRTGTGQRTYAHLMAS